MTRRREAARLLVRSLFVQGSINERTLIGSGFSWALLPPSRSTGREGTEAEAVVPGPEESFNSHPYLTPLALGATARARAEGMPSTELRSFLAALRSPLGSLGDRLIWSTWRPLCLLGALLGIVLGAPPAPVVAGVFLVYNGLHIFLRVWGLRVGLAHGTEVAPALGAARLPARSERLAALGVLILGVLAGLAIVHALGHGVPGGVWAGMGALLLLAGIRGGAAVRPWTRVLVLGLVSAGLLLP
ncbi:MAG: PTS system mannose/fructose/sorbose family transporter subunit IID [Gammaproteobacteria bacterium]|nr:PTS system mannose/fructose/sorbose family transporter subunit IID [Gammaproteobacteria bacterium]